MCFYFYAFLISCLHLSFSPVFSQENLLRKSLQEQPSDSHNNRHNRCESTDTDVASLHTLTRTTSATQTSPTDLVDWNQLPLVPQRSSSKVSDSGVGGSKKRSLSQLRGGERSWLILCFIFVDVFFVFWGDF